MGGRGSASGLSGSSFTTYTTAVDSKKGLGLGNGGETDRWMHGLDPKERSAKSTGDDSINILENKYIDKIGFTVV